MNSYIRADLHRLKTRIPRWILLGLYFLILMRIFWKMAGDASVTAYDISTSFIQILTWTAPILGVIEMVFVYGDDFKAKTMQIGIGHGIKRRHIILAKLIEYMVACTFDIMFVFVLDVCISRMRGVVLGTQFLGDMVVVALFALVKLYAAVESAMVLMFFVQSTAIANILYIAVAYGAFGMIFGLLQNTKALKNIHFTQYMLMKLIDVVKARALIGIVALPQLIGVILWLTVLYVVTSVLFEKRELEF